MTKFIFNLVIFSFFSLSVLAQETREELEKQRTKLKKEMEETQKLLNGNKAKTKENLLQWKLINDKLNMQNRLIENIGKDINLLDNSINTNRNHQQRNPDNRKPNRRWNPWSSTSSTCSSDRLIRIPGG